MVSDSSTAGSFELEEFEVEEEDSFVVEDSPHEDVAQPIQPYSFEPLAAAAAAAPAVLVEQGEDWGYNRMNVRKLLPLRSRRSVLLESIRRVRLKQLRGPSSQAPRASHVCLQCRASCRDCDALIMHRIRHTEGKHWPCPLCSKTFFRQRNVRNHIRTHQPKHYKCRQCIATS